MQPAAVQVDAETTEEIAGGFEGVTAAGPVVGCAAGGLVGGLVGVEAEQPCGGRGGGKPGLQLGQVPCGHTYSQQLMCHDLSRSVVIRQGVP